VFHDERLLAQRQAALMERPAGPARIAVLVRETDGSPPAAPIRSTEWLTRVDRLVFRAQLDAIDVEGVMPRRTRSIDRRPFLGRDAQRSSDCAGTNSPSWIGRSVDRSSGTIQARHTTIVLVVVEVLGFRNC